MPFKKGTAGYKKRARQDESEDTTTTARTEKKSKLNTGPIEMKMDEEGNAYWELSGKRRLAVSEFKGTTYVNIREYYEKDGKMLPGSKGISLPIDQWKTLVGVIPDVEKVLHERESQEEKDAESRKEKVGKVAKHISEEFVVDDDLEE